MKTNTIKGVPKVPRPSGARKVNRPREIEEFRIVLRAAKGGLKRAIALGGFAGASEADVRNLTLDDNIKQVSIMQKSKLVKVRLLEYVRQKTDTPVSQTLHPELAEILEPVKSGLLVKTRTGDPIHGGRLPSVVLQAHPEADQGGQGRTRADVSRAAPFRGHRACEQGR